MTNFRINISCMLLMAATLVGCGSAGHDHEAGDNHKDNHAGEIVMSHQAFHDAGITIETVTPAEFRQSVKCSGEIENASGAERVISAPASGIISFHQPLVVGSHIGSGQALFSVSSKGLEQNDQNATLAVDLAIAEKELRRADELIKDDLISRKEYDRIKSEYERARAASSTVGAHAGKALSISSPISGFITSLSVSPGQFVNMGDPIAVVAQNRRILLKANLSERYRDFLSQIVSANIVTPGDDTAISLSSLQPRVMSTTATSSKASHYFPVYIEFDNPGNLANGAVVEAWLLGNNRPDVISVPKSALVEEGGYMYAYVLEDEGEHEHEHEGAVIFRKVEIKTGASDGNRIEILSGLKPGDKIAATGALRIRMASMASSIPGHSHHH